MQSRDFNELAGRIEGLGRVVLHLVATLEVSGTVNGPVFTEALRRSVVPNGTPNPVMAAAKVTLEEIAKALDEGRRWRTFRRQAVASPGASTKRPSGRRKAG